MSSTSARPLSPRPSRKSSSRSRHSYTTSMSSPNRSPSPPTQVFHRSLMPHASPTSGLFPRYYGAKTKRMHRRSDIQRATFGAHGASVELDERRAQLLKDLQQLYSCQPSVEIFERSWRSDAAFEDPVSSCKGLNEIAAQFFAMPLIFKKSVTLSHRVISSTHNPNLLIYEQVQEYTVKLFGMKRTVKSIILVELDDEDKIILLEDQWNGEEPPHAWGLGMLRRLNSKTISLLVSVPKDLRRQR